MKAFFLGLILSITSLVYGETIQSRVHSMIEDVNRGTIIKWANGQTSFIPFGETKLLADLKSAKSDSLETTIDHDSNILAVSSFEESAELDVPAHMPLYSYEPTILKSEEDVSAMFWHARLPSQWQFSIQCYNVAHVRAYEEYKSTGTKTMKAFLFFTDRYIRNYRYKWWFHVTPMTFVSLNGRTEARIIDREWGNGPMTTQQWTNHFIYSGSTCPIIKRYSEYTANQEGSDCYIQPMSMYYWQPMHLEEMERTGIEKTQFDMNEIYWAYKRDM